MAEATAVPTRKVGAGLIAGSLTTIVVYISKDAFGYDMSGELAAAITTLVSFIVSYFIPNETPQERTS